MAGLFWGLPYFFIALALESFSTPTIVFARTLLGALVLVPYAALTGGLKPALKAWPYVVMFGLIEMVGPWFLITEAEKKHIFRSRRSFNCDCAVFCGGGVGYFPKGP